MSASIAATFDPNLRQATYDCLITTNHAATIGP
jgi:hypothetical protein